MIFTEEYKKSLEDVNFFERGFAGLLALNPYFEKLRVRLEKIITDIPEEDKIEFISKLKSKDDVLCLSTISELFVFEKLNSEFHNISIERPIDVIDNKTPDFWISDNDKYFVVEVATIFEQINPLEYEIIETLNKIKSDVKIMLGVIWNIKKRKGQIKLSKIKKDFEELFEKHKDITKPTDFVIHTDEGIILKGKLYKGNQSHQTVGSISHSYGFDLEDVDYKNVVRKRILQKLRKYKGLTTNNIPLIVVIYNKVSWLNEIKDWDEVLYGDKEYIFNENSSELEKIVRKNTIISPDKNTTLSAVLINDITEEGKYLYIDNPYARTKVNEELKNKILKAFNAIMVEILPINRIT